MTLQATGDGYLRSGRARFHEGLAPLMAPIDSVQPAPYNYNNGDLDAVVESIEVSGMYRPIYVQESTGYIIAGNHTWMGCKMLDSDVVPIVLLKVDDTQARRIMVADNHIASLAKPDNGLLMTLLDEIVEDAGELTGTGMTEQDLEVLRHLNEIPLDTQDFAQWPTLTVQLPPNVMRAYMWMTDKAEDDRSRFELMLRMAGWDGQ